MAKRINHEARRKLILEKAMRLFSQVGYNNVSLIMIAEASGIARTVMYRYYKDKREVLDAAIRANASLIMAQCREEIARTASARSKLKHICFHVADYLFGKREFLTAIYDFVLAMNRLGENMGSKVFEFTKGIRLAFQALLADGLAHGEILPEIEPVITTEVFLTEFEATTLRIILGMEKSAEDSKRRFIMMVDAICV